MAEQMEYYIKEKGENTYEVAKFSSMSGGDQPLAVYDVVYNPHRGTGKCNCPAGSFRGTGVNDKHVQMVIRWLREGKPLSIVAESGTKPKKPKLRPGFGG